MNHGFPDVSARSSSGSKAAPTCNGVEYALETELASPSSRRANFPMTLSALAEDQRRALLAAAPNFRDVGGHPARDGAAMKTGVVFRTGQLSALSEPAQEALIALRVEVVVDLRTDAEREPKPDTLPKDVRLAIANVLADNPTGGAAALASLANHDGGAPDIQAINSVINNGQAANLMLDTYRDFVRLPSALTAYRTLLTSIAEGDVPIAFHCTAGKDRTGWAAALIQSFVGVETELILADYLRSNDNTTETFEPFVSAFGQVGGDADALRALVEVRPEYLQAGLDQLEQTYGSLDGYLRQGLGLSNATLEKLWSTVV